MLRNMARYRTPMGWLKLLGKKIGLMGSCGLNGEKRAVQRSLPPKKGSFGTRLIDRVLSGDFAGKVELTYEPTGVVCRLVAPLASLLPNREEFAGTRMP